MKLSIAKMHKMNGADCSCGKAHRFTGQVLSGKGVISQLPALTRQLGGSKAFVLSDLNTYKAAGSKVCSLLSENAIPYTAYSFPHGDPDPDEQAVGSVFLHFDPSCDLIIGVGSGVINDIGKILSATTGKPYIIVATAPSMDGYASATSSMTRDGLKISLNSRSADIIVGDTDILCTAPLSMMASGLGDMLAKYVSICEWRIAHLITGEYYCPEVAALIRQALKACTDNAKGLLTGDAQAVQAVFEGLVIGGVAMNYAGLSRPASGVEHYISHVLDMRAAQFGTPAAFHGTQCAIGTLIAIRLYEKLKTITPDRETALRYAAGFSYEDWKNTLRSLLGDAAESMIALEKQEKKYDVTRHKERLEIILAHWKDILAIMEEELPDSKELEMLMLSVGLPTTLEEIGCGDVPLPLLFGATRDIRDKYVLSRLAWDLGSTEELVNAQ